MSALDDARGPLAGLPPVSMTLVDKATSASEFMGAIARAETTTAMSKANDQKGIGIISFLTAIGVAVAIFAVQITLFMLLRNKMARIFKPKTYLVPERERTESPSRKFLSMIRTLIFYHDREIINKCGLDAYFFLRYLKTLLVIFVPICLVVVPILLPVNYVGGKGNKFNISSQDKNSTQAGEPTGLDTLSWGNVRPANTARYVAHLVLALSAIIWVCFVIFFELRVYTKVRQDYLTSAEHRLRASATTVLVNSIPKKWLTVEALAGLFDVFPGGIRNIWLNRDLTPLLDKIGRRDDVHKQLESAETDLIKAVKKAQLKRQKADERETRRKLNLRGLSKQEQAARDAQQDAEAKRIAESDDIADAGHEKEIIPIVDDAASESPFNDRDATVVDDSINGDYDDVSKRKSGDGPSPRQQTGLGLKSVSGVGGRVIGGVNDAMDPTNGFADLDSSQKAPVAKDPSSVEGPEAARMSPPGASLNTSSSARATRDPFKVGSSMVNTVRKQDNVEDLYSHEAPKFWQFWKPPPGGYVYPVPQGTESADRAPKKDGWQPLKKLLPFMGPQEQPDDYDDAYESKYNSNAEEDALWANFIARKDRPSHRLPLFGVTWLFGLPFITEKVDTIYWCRQELARLNLEIEEDQKHPEKFPLMSSAFIQFNHQIAAHMACQSLVHHIPKQMGPRLLEISPRDVQWENMAVKWWQELLRTSAAIILIVAMIILWTIPVGWTAALGQVDTLIKDADFLQHLKDNPRTANVVRAIAGVLPAAVLAILFALVPVILGLLSSFQGAKTGSQRSELVQRYYFTFLFVQIFLVVSIASFVFKSLDQIVEQFKDLSTVTSILNLLANNLPSAAIYFFSYMILQAFSVSSGTLLQIGALFNWFIMAPLFDSTPRSKWSRNTTLNQINWGSLFPVYTNFACIGIIYCVIAPLISIFMIITFSLLWLAQRYAMLYVNRFELDTGGVLYPRAINQTFTGLYFMELCLAGLFFIVVDEREVHVCTAHGAIMICAAILTMIYQVKLNRAFSPLFRYLPVTFEDEAVLRDEAFQRAQDARFGLIPEENEDGVEGEEVDMAHEEKPPGTASSEKDIEMHGLGPGQRNKPHQYLKPVKQVGGWAKSGGKQVGTWAKGGGQQIRKLKHLGDQSRAAQYRRRQRNKDIETQRAMGEALFGGYHDEIEDLTSEERDALTQHAFLHKALRARRPTVWIPRDDLGVSDDEIRQTHAFSSYIDISNEGTALDSKVRVVYGKSPPDFSEADIINL